MERNGTHASTGAGARTRKQHATSTQDLRDSSEREHVSAAFAQQGTRHPELIRTATHPNPLQRSRPPAPAAQKSPEHHPLLPRLPAEPRSSQHPDTGTAPPADNTARASALRENVFPGPRWGRRAPPRRDVSQTTDLLDPSGRSQGMRMIMCREHPDESARRDSRTSASAVFAPVARIPCSTMRRHVLMHEDDGKSQCRPPSMGSSAMTSPEPSPLIS